MKSSDLSPRIAETSPADAPLELMLLADPSEPKVAAYLPRSRCFAAYSGVLPVAVCIVAPLSEAAYEIMNIAVTPSQQKKGIGTTLLSHVISVFRTEGAWRLEVGTGTFGYQLAFYQRQGFRVTGIDTDFFLTNYPEPIFEDGIQLKDMLRLTLVLRPFPEKG
ncbi:GNAT family N-acetyltransferase [Desulfolutivibrio sp.]|uniref:GNAT family N-acetyltransferase n=1 Tax=Desulfolutivibrio sp. TaxID=2773296 RepID=UPI002F969067